MKNTTYTTEENLEAVLLGTDFSEANEIGSFADNETIQLNAIYNHLQKTHAVLLNKNALGQTLLGASEIDNNYIDMIGYALNHWDTNLLGALDILENEEENWNSFSGLSGLSDEAVDSLGRPIKKQFFKNIKSSVNQIKKGFKPTLKKVGAAIVKYNPLSLAARGGFLLALKVNLFKIAEKLYPAYLTPLQAQQNGFNQQQYNHAKQALLKVENIFVKNLKGSADALKKAITTGRAAKKIQAKNLNGIGQLGEPVQLTAILSAAAPLLKAFNATNTSSATAQNSATGTEQSSADTVAAGVAVGKFILAIKDWFKAKNAGKDANKLVSPNSTDPGTNIIQINNDETIPKTAGNFVLENPGKSIAIGAALLLAFSSNARKAIGLS